MFIKNVYKILFKNVSKTIHEQGETILKEVNLDPKMRK